jgi:hypothetical protein
MAEGRVMLTLVRRRALKLMREAADLEDNNEKHIVTPGRILPACELLGDISASEPDNNLGQTSRLH